MLLSDLDQKEKAYGTLFLFAIIAIIFYYVSDDFSKFISTSNPFLGIFIAIILNPAYLFLIYILWERYELRGVIAGILISLGIDVISLTHSINKLGILPVDGSALPLYGYSDTTIFKIIMPYVQGTTATFILYVIIPIALFYLALRVVRKTSSFNRIFKEAI